MQIWPGGVENLSLIGQFALEKSLKSINYLVPQNTIIYTGMNIHKTYFKIHFKKEAKNDVICHHLFLVVLKNCYLYDVYTEIDASWN